MSFLGNKSVFYGKRGSFYIFLKNDSTNLYQFFHSLGENTCSLQHAVKMLYRANKVFVFSAPSMPLSCYNGDIFSDGTDVLISNGQCDGIQLKLSTGGNLYLLSIFFNICFKQNLIN